MKATPEGSNKASKKPTLFIDVNDPRLKRTNAGITYARSNAEINPVNLSAVSLSALSSATLAGNNLNALNQITGTDSSLGVIATNNGQFTQANAPLQVTGLTASYVGDTIVVNFTFDLSDTLNASFTHILFKVYSSVTNTYLSLVSSFSKDLLSTSGSSQTVKLTPYFLSETGVGNTTVFTKVELATFASIYTNGYVESNTFAYTCDLPVPVITASHSTGSYSVSITNLATLQTYADFGDVIVQEYITNNNLTQVQAADTAGTSTWNQIAPATKTTPLNILALDGAHRWIRAYSESTSGGRSVASTYVDTTPDAVNPTNLTPPDNFTSATATWSGKDIVITWVMPASNAGNTLRVKLVPVQNGSISAGLYGYFYIPISSGQTSGTITNAQIVGIFGKNYSSFQAHIDAISNVGSASTTVIDISTFTRTNPLAGVTPTATVSNVIDGFSVQFDLSKYEADYAEVYEYFVDPSMMISMMTDLHDYMDAEWSSGGANGATTIVLKNWTGEDGQTIDPTYCEGQLITGTNIQPNTYVTAINGLGPTYTVTLSKPLTGQASGFYHMQALVYSGTTAANIFSNIYQTQYIVVVYYDNFDNNSMPSNTYLAFPINPSQSVIANAVQVGSPNGAIWVGNGSGATKTTGARVVLGSSLDGSYSGIFAFDAGSTSSTAPTTSIISNDNNGHSYTFETQNAKIANWIIGTDRIQNTLGTSSNYVGMAASGNYSFWAGSTTNGGDSLAKFSVTPQGAVIARSISIYGNGTDNTTLTIGGSTYSNSPFAVDAQGNMKATSATISGDITAVSGNFTGNVNLVGTNGILGAYSSGATQTSGSRVMFRSTGIYAYDGSNAAPTTAIFSTPLAGAYTFQTWQALLGKDAAHGWVITGNDNATTISSNKITLSSNTETITVLAADSNQNGVVISGASGTGSGYAITSGTLNPSTANFTVTHGGVLTAVGATITGVLKSRTSSTGVNVSSTSQSTDGVPGYYFDSSGSFIMGSFDSYIQYQGTGSINIIGSKTSYTYLDTVYSGYSGDGAGIRANTYGAGSKIILNPTNRGLNIFGMPIQGNTNSSGYYHTYANENNPGSFGLGALGRQRMLVEDPYDGMVRLGMGIYYQDSSSGGVSGTHTSAPTYTSGYVGDLWVVF